MTFKDYEIQISYRSIGEVEFSDIINPLLGITKIYKRSVGFFDSSSLHFISPGIINLANNNGKINLITSPKLSEKDILAINLGYKLKGEVYKERFVGEIKHAIELLDDDNLSLLVHLIISDVFLIKVVTKQGYGMYHDKLAILEDFEGNKLVFTGSNNETATGYGANGEGNYEKIRTFKSWVDFEGRITDEELEFSEIWNGNNKYLDTYDFTDAFNKSILEEAENRSVKRDQKIFKLYDYQKKAIDAWVNNNYNGFFVMATGTGKTITALYSLKKIEEKENYIAVIAVPYIHLISQWHDDIINIFPNTKVFKAFSEIPEWENNIINSLVYNIYNEKKNIIIITTIKSLFLNKFQDIIPYINTKSVLIVDEAHNFLNKIYEFEWINNFDYKLGLSATPVFGRDEQKTVDLLNFFGGTIFELPIEKAIGRYLVNYEYHPIFIDMSEEEEENIVFYSRRIASCFDTNGKLIDRDKFIKAYRGRLRVISMAQEKINRLEEFIQYIEAKDHFIIYCSDGRVLSNDNVDMKHLLYVVNKLNELGYYPSQFTASENMKERIKLINNFNRGYISTLVAIRCLDEGINIPSIETALILSSNDNYREFVQRRGRILRKHDGKKKAKIYDIIVLPSIETKVVAEIELRRFYEYAKLSINKDKLFPILEEKMNKYDLSYEDISFKNEYIKYEGDLDD